MMIGTAPAATATASVEVQKPKKPKSMVLLAERQKSFRARQAVCQVTRKRHAQGRVRPQLDVVDVLVPATVLQLADESFDLFEITFAQRPRVGEQLGIF